MTTAPARTEARERLLLGLAEALRTQDFGEVTIADIVQHARTSRRTFYECFGSKQDCFVALVHEVNRQRREALVDAVDPHAPWQQQIRQALNALFRAVELEPEAFIRAMREVHSLGDRGRDLVRDDLAAFTDVLLALSQTPELQAAGVRQPSKETAIVLVGGVRELVISTLEAGEDPSALTEPVAAIFEQLLGPGH